MLTTGRRVRKVLADIKVDLSEAAIEQSANRVRLDTERLQLEYRRNDPADRGAAVPPPPPKPTNTE